VNLFKQLILNRSVVWGSIWITSILFLACASVPRGKLLPSHIDPDAYYFAGKAALQHGDYHLAKTYIRQSVQAAPQAPAEWYYFYAFTRQHLEQPDRGRTVLEDYAHYLTEQSVSQDSLVPLVQYWLQRYPHLPEKPPIPAQFQHQTPASSYDTANLRPPQIQGGYRQLQRYLIYPDSLQAQHIEGEVMVQARIAPSGAVDTLQITSGVRSPLLNQIAKNAVQRGQYTPGTKAGQPIMMWISLPIQFRLQ